MTKMTISPRIIKTHLPLELLPPKLLQTCKVIYVARNPIDICVSYYNHMKTSSGVQRYDYDGTFEDFSKAFMNGTVESGSYWTMLKVKRFAILIHRHTPGWTGLGKLPAPQRGRRGQGSLGTPI